MAKFLFPDSQSRSPKSPTVLCPADRVLAIYNQDSGDEAQRISKKVREWFFEEAHRKGWHGVHFVPEVQSRHGAGCIMWVTFGAGRQVMVTNQILVLEDSDSDADD
ncbi:hypothetical protein HBO18_30085 [Pseudomonas lactis]|uniref:Uncharacterized protein n=1 Tax=Pseudomonas lactis TaxID=1615674 RepID=A0A7Y1Q3H3_9PSED|nr:hypothetical protein [Pseudomonas lactis]NNA48369.1 hypothetical protein [Pseudomonas lactis]